MWCQITCTNNNLYWNHVNLQYKQKTKTFKIIQTKITILYKVVCTERDLVACLVRCFLIFGHHDDASCSSSHWTKCASFLDMRVSHFERLLMKIPWRMQVQLFTYLIKHCVCKYDVTLSIFEDFLSKIVCIRGIVLWSIVFLFNWGFSLWII